VSSSTLELRLYIAGKSPNSMRALTNLHTICREWLGDDCWQLEVIDIFTDPARAVADNILVTPTLVKLTPPVVRIVGDLSRRETVLAALDLEERKNEWQSPRLDEENASD
jgi:circadian clock protein KaiB